MSKDPSSLPFRLIRTSRGGFKLTEGGYILRETESRRSDALAMREERSIQSKSAY